jgi:hypothetical protein
VDHRATTTVTLEPFAGDGTDAAINPHATSVIAVIKATGRDAEADHVVAFPVVRLGALQGVPVYVIFLDATLRQIATASP